MKVLVISHTYISQINRDKWKILANRHKDLTIKVIFPHEWPTHLFKHKAHIKPEENLNNCTFSALQSFKVGDERSYGYYSKPLRKLLYSFRPDIIHVEQGASAFSYFQVIFFTKLLGISSKFLFFTWVNWRPQSTSIKHKLFWRFIEQFNLQHSDGAIAGNQDAQEILLEKGLRKKTIVVPQLGVNQQVFSPATKTSLRNKKSIAYIGRIVREKGVFLLASSFAKLAEQYPDWNLIFVGAGTEEKELIDFTIEKRLLERIEFKDPIRHKEVARILQKTDILVLPSYDTPKWKEQFGHVLIEAMSCKVPVLASTGGEIPNVVAQAGLVFNQKNELELEEKLEQLMSNEVLRKTLGEKGLERVENNYSHEIIADKTYKYWQMLSKESIQ